MKDLLIWARANPATARLGLRFLVRLGLALALIYPLQAICLAFGLSANVALVGGLGAAVLFGRAAADRLADHQEIPRLG